MFAGDILGLISVENSKQLRHWKQLDGVLACALASGSVLQISNDRDNRRNFMGLNFSISVLCLEGKIGK